LNHFTVPVWGVVMAMLSGRGFPHGRARRGANAKNIIGGGFDNGPPGRAGGWKRPRDADSCETSARPW
jgi:hypothetical protein